MMMVYRSPMGLWKLVVDDNGLRCVEFLRVDFSPNASEIISVSSGKAAREILLWATAELDEYFHGERQRFTVPLSLFGTPFQLSVWNILMDIPYGETRSYGEVAAALNDPHAARAVGQANNKNPLPIFVPCHRVVGRDGGLRGYRWGSDIKRWLIEFERVHR